ncbi:transposable element Tcb1 transposase [Trichonephila clavipes]|nr:transposable element Tcb1 transposase [Trichonephila clavipes]
MSRRKQRSPFDQLSESDRGRIVTYRDCGLSFREIGSRVGPVVLDSGGYDGPTWSIVSTSVHHFTLGQANLSARTIRRRLQQSGLSARRPLLGLPLSQNHRCLRRQWCVKEGCG